MEAKYIRILKYKMFDCKHGLSECIMYYTHYNVCHCEFEIGPCRICSIVRLCSTVFHCDTIAMHCDTIGTARVQLGPQSS